MPEHNIIDIDDILHVMDKTLGEMKTPMLEPDELIEYFNFFDLTQVINFDDKLSHIIDLPEVTNDDKLANTIALIGINIWVQSWRAYINIVSDQKLTHEKYQDAMQKPITHIIKYANQVSIENQDIQPMISKLTNYQKQLIPKRDLYYDVQLTNLKRKYKKEYHPKYKMFNTYPQTSDYIWNSLIIDIMRNIPMLTNYLRTILKINTLICDIDSHVNSNKEFISTVESNLKRIIESHSVKDQDGCKEYPVRNHHVFGVIAPE